MTDPTPDVKSLFGQALEVPAADRAAFLDAACAGRPAARAELDALLAALDRAGDFLNRPPAQPAAGVTGTFAPEAVPEAPTADFPGTDEHVGAVLGGRYKLIEAIGEGGMGSVYMALQTEPVKRAVAVKVIKAGMDTKAVLARFEAERQALAMMDHPNIARVLDAGTTESGRPFFVMELVKGVPITEYCDARRLTPPGRLELFAAVCQAIQHAHMKGVIHRDIKPSNVLVALYDDKPVPKVIDFGVAKATGPTLTDKTLMTGYGAVVGTPEYMSPEQASLNNLDVDTRSDVYALGVLLYELLTGSTPVDRKSLGRAAVLEILRVVREVDAPRPSLKLSTSDALPSISANRGTEPKKLAGLLRNELDWIVMKALEKDRTRRYDSANAFAADVQRYLSGEQVQAVPPSIGYRLRKAYRRNKAAVWVATAFTLMLTLGLVGTTWGLIEADRQRRVAVEEREKAEDATILKGEAVLGAMVKEAEADRERLAALAARDDARRTHYAAQMNLAQNAYNANDSQSCLRLLDELRPKPGEPDLRGIEWDAMYCAFHTYERIVPLPGAARAVYSTHITRDGKRIVYIGEVLLQDGKRAEKYQLIIRELPSGVLLKEIPIPDLPPEKPRPGQPPPPMPDEPPGKDGTPAMIYGFKLDLSDDGGVVAVTQKGRCLIYNTTAAKILYRLEDEKYGTTWIDGSVTVSGSGNRAVFIIGSVRHNLKRGQPHIVVDLPEGKEIVRNLTTIPNVPFLNYDGRLMAYGATEDAVIADTVTEEVQQRFPKLTPSQLTPWSPAGVGTVQLNRAGTQLLHRYLALTPEETPLRVRSSRIYATEIWDVSKKQRVVSDVSDKRFAAMMSYSGESILETDRQIYLANREFHSGAIWVLDAGSRQLAATIRPPLPVQALTADSSGKVYGVSAKGDLYIWSIPPLPSDPSDPRYVARRNGPVGGGQAVRASPTFLAGSSDGNRFAFYYRENLAKDDPGEPITRLTLVEGDRGPLLKSITPTADQNLTFKFSPSNCALDPAGTTLYGIQYEATNPNDPSTMRSRLWRWDTQANKLVSYGDTWPSAGLVLRQMAITADGSALSP